VTTSSKTIQAFIGVGFLAVLALSASAQECAAAKSAAQTDSKDIVQTAIAAGQFKTLVKAVEAAGLAKTLSGKGPFTVFAPTDEAFSKLAEGALEGLLKNPEALKSVLLYHVVPGKVMAVDVAKLKTAKTALGQSVTIDTSKDVRVDNAKVV